MSISSSSGPKPVEPIQGEADAAWTIWRALIGDFTLGRLLRDLAMSRSGWGIYGVDLISTLRTTTAARRALARLADIPERQLDMLSDLAAVNARRNEAMWRMAALFYVSAPVTLFLASLQGAPQLMREMFRISGLLLLGLVVLLTIWLLYYFATNWRARQIEAVIDLARIERGLTIRR